MKHRLDLKTLRIAALAAMLAPTAAMAQVQTYYRSGTWEAFSGRNDKGGAVCGIDNTNPSDHRRISIRFDIGASESMLSASKPDWAIPDGTRITVVMQLGLNTPWIRSATGNGHNIDWSMGPTAMQTFEQQFRSATSMTLTFPDGNEPPWTVPLIGSSAISATFSRCITDLTRQVQASKAASQAATPAQPAPTQNATQPFNTSTTNATPPANTPAPAAQSSGNQSSGTQSSGNQSSATQSSGNQPAAAPQTGTAPPAH